MKQFITDNLFIVIMVAVAAIALIAVAFPVMQIGAANEYAGQLRQKDSELTAAMSRDASPDWNHESENGLKEIKAIQERVIERALKKATRPPLLVKNKLIFPSPDIVSGSRFDFQYDYHDGLAGLLKTMQAEGLPTEREIIDETAREKARIESRPGQKADANLAERVRTDLIVERAKRIRLWATTGSFDNALGALVAGNAMNDQQLWTALVNYWIQKDIAEVIADFNRKPFPVQQGRQTVFVTPKNVLDSPIKELVSVRIEPRYYFEQQAGGGDGGPAGSAGPKVTITGRVTNPRYHVMIYEFKIVMDPSRFNDLMGELQAKNFHTVISYRQESPDRKGVQPGVAPPGGMPPAAGGPAGQARYEYGANAVSLYTLNCEAIFMNSPASWRGQNEQESRNKRLAFLRDPNNRKLVQEVHEVRGNSRSVVLANAALKANPAKLDELLQTDNPNLRFIFLYEDLMPDDVKRKDPRLYQQ